MPFRNIVDDTSESVSAATPGWTVDLRNHTTHRLRAVGVPVRFKVCVHTTAANDTGALLLVDSTGTPLITCLINGPATTSPIGDWYWADGYVPATLQKLDVHYGGNTSGTLTPFSASLYEIDWTTDPVTGSASMTLGALTASADGGFRGESALSLGGMTVAAEGTVVSPAPAYKAIGSQVGAASGSVSPSWPASHAADDYAICVVVTAKFVGDPGAATLSSANGFTAVAGGSDSTTDGTSYTRVTLFECRATGGSMSAPTVAAGTHDLGITAVIITWSGCTTSGSAVDAVAVSGNASSNSAVTVTGATTTGGNRAVLLAIGSASNVSCGSYSNGNLTSISERLDALVNIRLALATATAAASGSYGNTTATLSGNALWAAVTVALKG